MEDTQSVEVNGEIGASVWVNGINVGTIGADGKLTITVTTHLLRKQTNYNKTQHYD